MSAGWVACRLLVLVGCSQLPVNRRMKMLPKMRIVASANWRSRERIGPVSTWACVGAAVTVAGGLSPGWTRRVTGCLRVSRLAPASEAAIRVTQATTRERTSGSLCLPRKGRSEAAEAPPGSPGDHGPYLGSRPGAIEAAGSRGRVHARPRSSPAWKKAAIAIGRDGKVGRGSEGPAGFMVPSHCQIPD